MQSFLYSVFHVLTLKNGTDWKLYQPMLPAFPIAFQWYIDFRCTWKRFRDISGKLKCSIFHVFRFPLISRKRFHVQRRSIYFWKAIEKAGDIGWFDFQSVPFSAVKNRENGTCKVFYVPFSTFLTLENGTDWKLYQPMSPAFPIAFQGYIDLHCTWKRFWDISGKLKCSIFHVFRFPLISRKRFHVQRRSIYPWKAIGKAGDIGWFNFQSVSFSTVKNVKNETCKFSMFRFPRF